MYHTGGSGSMILGVYDGESLPDNRLAVTCTTPVSGITGWQTIDLSSPAFVAGGETVWLAWVYESNPGIYYQNGGPGRADAGVGWSGDDDMPDPFGISTQEDFIYSIYATYTPKYTLTTNTAGQGSITLDPPGGIYNEDTVVTLTAEPASGWQFDGWSGDLSGTANPTTIIMDSNKTVTATFVRWVGCSGTGTVGYTTVFSLSTTTANRRAMPFTMPENCTISSVTMYHNGGSGSMIMGVYDGESFPNNRLGVTASTAVSGSTGWQTIDLTNPAFVASGAKIWLAWVYQSNPGIRYQTGAPGRADAGVGWSGGMPDPFGSSTQSNYIYSIYATYGDY
jgi:uncharacterized repeat protein (TIGR02543 family)